MFKAAKPPASASQKPGIWAEGAQFAPLSPGPLLRAGAIVARRKAAQVWLWASKRVSLGALAIEDGAGAGFIGRLGRGAAALPPRVSVVWGMTGLSQLLRTAAQSVDHQREPVEPLAFGDLRDFLQHRRTERETAERDRLRKDQLGLSARNRAAALVRRSAPAKPDFAQMSPADLLDQTDKLHATHASSLGTQDAAQAVMGPIDAAELLAIRAALASVPALPEPAPKAFVAPPAPRQNPRLFAPAPTAQPIPFPATEPAVGPGETAVPQAAGSKRLRSGLGLLTLATLKGLGRMFRAVAGPMWRMIGPAIHTAFAAGLGWAMVGLCLPYGIGKSVLMHANGHDLRHFD